MVERDPPEALGARRHAEDERQEWNRHAYTPTRLAPQSPAEGPQGHRQAWGIPSGSLGSRVMSSLGTVSSDSWCSDTQLLERARGHDRIEDHFADEDGREEIGE